MYVNIEFLDEEPLENVITSLHYHMDKTIFIGFHDDVEAYKKRTTFFLEKYCHVKEIKFNRSFTHLRDVSRFLRYGGLPKPKQATQSGMH